MTKVYVGDGILVTGDFDPMPRERTQEDRLAEQAAYLLEEDDD
jgi:hypothetical protein